jgi:hypothetical protein
MALVIVVEGAVLAREGWEEKAPVTTGDCLKFTDSRRGRKKGETAELGLVGDHVGGES